MRSKSKMINSKKLSESSLKNKTMAEESSATEFKPFGVVIKNHYEPIYSLHLAIESPDLTIGKLKTLIEEQHKGNPLVQDQLLVYRGKLLESQTRLFSLCEPNNDTTKSSLPSLYIHMTLRGGFATAAKIGLSPKTFTNCRPSKFLSSFTCSSASFIFITAVNALFTTAVTV